MSRLRPSRSAGSIRSARSEADSLCAISPCEAVLAAIRKRRNLPRRLRCPEYRRHCFVRVGGTSQGIHQGRTIAPACCSPSENSPRRPLRERVATSPAKHLSVKEYGKVNGRTSGRSSCDLVRVPRFSMATDMAASDNRRAPSQIFVSQPRHPCSCSERSAALGGRWRRITRRLRPLSLRKWTLGAVLWVAIVAARRRPSARRDTRDWLDGFDNEGQMYPGVRCSVRLPGQRSRLRKLTS